MTTYANYTVNEIAALSINEVVAITAQEWKTVTPAAMSGLTAAQITVIPVAAVASFSAAQLAGVSTASLAALNVQQIAAISSAALKGLSELQKTVLAMVTLNEDSLHVFSISTLALADSGTTVLTTTISVTQGIVKLSSLSSGAVVTGDSSASMTLVGTAAQINTALTGLTYQPNANYNGAAALRVSTTDGGAFVSSRGVAIRVVGINDAPVVGVPGAQSFNEDTVRVFSNANQNAIKVADVENGFLTTTLTTTNGKLALGNTDSGASIAGGANNSDTITLSGTAEEINAAIDGLAYTPDANYNGISELNLTVNDGALSITRTIALTVSPVNDAPVIVARDAEFFNEDTPQRFGNATNNAIKVSDVDDIELTTTLTVSEGTLKLGSLPKGATITAGSDNSKTVTLSGTAEQINQAISNLTYTPLPNANGTNILTVTANDRANALSGTKSLYFDGFENHVTLSDPGISGDITIEAWVNTTAPLSDVSLFEFSGFDGLRVVDSIVLRFDGLGRLQFCSVDDGVGRPDIWITNPSALKLGSHHVAASISNDGTGTIYVDGVKVVSGFVGAAASTARGVSYIGRSTWVGTSFFSGQMRDIRVWDTERTESEVNAQMGTWITSAPESADAKGLKVWIPVTDTGALTNMANGAVTPAAQPYQPALVAAESITKTIRLLVIPVEDSSVIKGDLSAKLTEANAVLTTSGKLILTDVNNAVSATPFVAQTDAVGSGKYGKFTLFKTGAWTYTTDTAHNEFLEGITYTDTLSVSTTDGTSATITVTVVGTNDAAVISGTTSVELKETNRALKTSGKLDISDVDSPATFAAQTDAVGSGNYGKFSLRNTGDWSYVADSAHNEFVAGQKYTDTLIVAATDGTLATITVTIVGTDDAAVIGGDVSAKLTETNVVLNTSGQLTLTDVDSTDNATSFIAQTNAEGSGSYGKFSLSNTGAWTYATNTAHDEFVAGKTYTDTLRVLTTDGARAMITVTIVGTNDAGVISGTSSAALVETNAVLKTSGKLDITDVDGPASFAARKNAVGSGKYGKFNLSSTGEWTYATNTAHNEFIAGEIHTDTLKVFATDGTPATITVTIVGTNEAAVIGGTVSVKLTETNAVLTTKGRLTLTDADNTVSATPFIAQTNVEGSGKYGKFILLDTGAWTYTTNTAHNEFVAGVTYKDTLSVAATDGTLATITVTIVGTNDAAVFGGTRTLNIYESDVAQTVSGTLTVMDVDSSQSFKEVTSVVGRKGYGKFSISSDGKWSYTTNTAHNEFVAGAKYSESAVVYSADGTSVSLVANIFGTNDAPVINVARSSESFKQGSTHVFSSTYNNAISVDDVDSTALTTTLTATQGTLLLGTLGSGATITAGANNSASITLSGTAAQINAAISGLVYTPKASYSGSVALSVTTSDGVLNSMQNIALTVVATINQAPTIKTGPTNENLDEDTTLVFSSSTGNAITVDDVDSTDLITTVKVSKGTLVLGSKSSGVAVTEGSDNSASMTLTGTVAQINLALDGLTYKPLAVTSEFETLTITTSDKKTAIAKTIGLNIADSASLSGWTSAMVAALSAHKITKLTARKIGTLSVSAASGFTDIQMPYLSSAALAAFTVAQVAALSANAVAQLSSNQIRAMSPTALLGLTNIQIRALSDYSVFGLAAATLAGLNFADQLSHLSGVQIAGLSPTAVGGLTVAQLLMFSNEQLKYLTDAQLKALEGQKLEDGAAITIDGLTMPRVITSTSNSLEISSWTQNQFKLLSPGQLNAMTADQIGALNPISLVGLSTTDLFAKITVAQRKGLQTAQYMALTKASRNSLTSQQLSELGDNFLKQMTAAGLMSMTTAQRQGLSDIQMQSLPLNVTSEFTSNNLNQLIAEGLFTRLTGPQVRALSAAALEGLNGDSFTGLVTANFKGLTTTQIAKLPSSVWAQATGAVLSSMYILSFQAINKEQLGQISASTLASLTDKRWSEISPEQVGFLNADQLAAKGDNLKALRVEGLTADQIRHLKTAQLLSLNGTELAKLSYSEKGGLSAMSGFTEQQISAIDSSKFRFFSPQQLRKLPPKVLGSISFEKINKLSLVQLEAYQAVATVANYPDEQDWTDDIGNYAANPKIEEIKNNYARATANKAAGLKLAKLLFASNKILDGAGSAPHKSINNSGDWDNLKASSTDPTYGDEIALFEYIDSPGGLYSWRSSDDDVEANKFVIRKKFNDVGGWQSTYEPVWENPPKTNEAGGYRQGNPETSISLDFASLFAKSDIYGRNHLLSNLHNVSFTVPGPALGGDLVSQEVATKLSPYITRDAAIYLSAAVLNNTTNDGFRDMLKVYSLWGKWPAVPINEIANGAVAVDNPFGPGVLGQLSLEKLKIYFNYITNNETNRGYPRPSYFSDELWADFTLNINLTSNVAIIVNEYLQTVSVRQLQSMPGDLVGQISGEALIRLVDSNLDLFKSFTASQISCLSKTAINALLEKIVNFTADQFLAFTGVQIMGIQSPAAWNAVVANFSDIAQNYIDRNPLYLSGTTITALTPAQIALLPSLVVQNLSEENMKAFSAKQIESLSVEQVSLLTPNQILWIGSNIGSLATEAIRILTIEQLATLSDTQKVSLKTRGVTPIVNMTAAEIASTKTSELLNFSGKALSKLSDAQLSALTKTQVLNLLPSQYLTLSVAQRNGLKSMPASFMNKVQIAGLSLTDIQTLEGLQVALLSAAQLHAMSTEQIQAFSLEQIKYIQPWVIGSLQVSDLSKFSDSQVGNLTPADLINIDSETARQLSKKWAKLLSSDSTSYLTTISEPQPRSAKDLRYVYSLSNLARSERSFLDTYCSSLQRNRVDLPMDTNDDGKLQAIFISQQTFRLNQRQSVYQRQLLQRGRAFGSILALGSVISAFGMAHYSSSSGDKEKAAMYSLAGLAYFASLLQVPLNEIVTYFVTFKNLKTSIYAYEVIIEEINHELVTIMDENYNSEHERRLVLADPLERKRVQTELRDNKERELRLLQEVGNEKWGSKNIFSMWTEADVENAQRTLQRTVDVPDVVGLRDMRAKASWTTHDNFFRFWSWDVKRAAASIFMVTDALGLVYSSYQLDVAMKKGDGAGIAFGVIDTLGSTLVLIGDGVDFRYKPSMKTSVVGAKFLGVGLLLAQLASSGASLYSNAKYFVDNPKNSHARDAVIADTFIQFSMLAITAVLMCAGPIGIIAGAFIAFAMPNAEAIRKVSELKDAQSSFLTNHRTVWGNTVLPVFIKIAEMNVNALTALGSFDFANAELTRLAQKMRGGEMQKLLGEDYKFSLANEETPDEANIGKVVKNKTLNTITTDIETSLVNATDNDSKIASFINIVRQEAKEKDYYARVATEADRTLTYASRLDVRKKKADGTFDFDAVAIGLSEQDKTIDIVIDDVQGSVKDSVIIVNLSSYTTVKDTKMITIVNNTKKNKVNFYAITDNLNITGSVKQGSTITVVEGQANNLNVRSLSGLDIISYSGAKFNSDGTIASASDRQFWNTIDLNAYVNVAAVIAGATTLHNIVTGNNAKQRYVFNNGRDEVTMTGGQGAAVVGGRGTALTMGNGNNYVSVKLGGRVDGMLWDSNALEGEYDGGLTAASTGTVGERDYLHGTNTISFAEAYAKVKIDIVDPLSKNASSLVTTVGLDIQDTGRFKNFQTVVGSNFGDIVNVTAASTLQSLILGMGQNSVSVSGVKAPSKRSAAGSSTLMITALISLDLAHSDITISDSDVGFEGNLNSNNLIQVSNASTLTGALRGSDRIFTDDNANNAVMVAYAEGQHVLNLHGGRAEVMMVAGQSGDAVITVDENAKTAITTALILCGDELSQMVSRDADGLHFSLAQTNGDAQEVDYSFGNETSDLASNKLTVVKLFKSDGKQIAITVAALSDAINSLSGAANYSALSSTYTFDKLYNEAVLVQPKS